VSFSGYQYAIGTDQNDVRMFDLRTHREICRMPAQIKPADWVRVCQRVG
jgi:hypothetical protein